MNHPTKPATGAWPAIHGGLLVLGLIVVGCLPGLIWPWYMLLPVAAYFGVALMVPPLRRTMPAISAGRVDRIGTTTAVILSGICIIVLLGYQAIFQPDVSVLAGRFPAVMVSYLVFGGVCFSLVNAVLEELIWRWMLYEALVAEWGNWPAVAATSAGFGISHLHGYPPGPLGAVLAGAYGFALVLLRWWTGGLALSIVCHVCADATIFWILCENVFLPQTTP